MEITTFFVSLFVLALSVLGICVLLYFCIIELSEKRIISFFDYLLYACILVAVFVYTDLGHSSTKLKYSINKTEIEKNFKKDVQNIVTKSSGYNKYRLINIKNGTIINLSESEFVQLSCENYNINTFTVMREYSVIGLKFNFDTGREQSGIVCYEIGKGL